MFATLNAGTANRALTVADLNVPDSGTGSACGLHADPVGRISNPSYGIDLFEPATAGVGQHSNADNSTASQDWNPGPQAGHVGRISNPSYWESTMSFANAAVQLLEKGPSESLLSHSRLINAQDLDDFWSSIAASRLFPNTL